MPSIKNAVNYAKNLPNVIAVSMSFGWSEYTSGLLGSGSLSDADFVSPTGHPEVFIAASGDHGFTQDLDGEPEVSYPASSPNVLSVGGTTLNYNLTTNSYTSEQVWNSGFGEGGGGGFSVLESEPAYQVGAIPTSYPYSVNWPGETGSGTFVNSPGATDGARCRISGRTGQFLGAGAPITRGVPIYDPYFTAAESTLSGTSDGGPWESIGGTSLGAPSWAGIVADLDQGRAIDGLSAINGTGQGGLLNDIYAIYGTQNAFPTLSSSYSSDFNDIVSGTNNLWEAAPAMIRPPGSARPRPCLF